MHHIFHTQAFILSSRPQGEANMVYSLYTRELGLIRATAQGVRLEKSKLRYALQDFSVARIDLVRGKDIWRITSATPGFLYTEVQSHVVGMRLLTRTSALIERLVQGESEVHEHIYDDVLALLHYLDTTSYEVKRYETAELCFVLRLLKELGYIGNYEQYALYTREDFLFSDIEHVSFDKKTLVFEINRALRESHL
jgi:DNA repair protein RecO (recombination protein O)